MTDVFVSYARSTEAEARRIGGFLEDAGYAVWRDDQLPAHRAYTDVIEEHLRAAKAVLVLWSAEAVRSDWVRAEADTGRKSGRLVQATLDGVTPPLPFDQIQCVDLSIWRGDRNAQAWRGVLAGIADLCGREASASPRAQRASAREERRVSVAVLPFANLSGDPEQSYFSDGITEDIITDLGKVSAVSVTARNTVFTYRDKAVNVAEVASSLKVSHVLEGSVRKSGNRVRITTQLIDGATGDQVWSERYDRDLVDIFDLQEEISKAIVAALRVKLLPQERAAVEQRGTTVPEAFNLYLMARQMHATRNMTEAVNAERLVALCRNAVELDPNYARAWALLATGLNMLWRSGHAGQAGLFAAERALTLDPDLAEAHVARASILRASGNAEAALTEVERALALDPMSHQANMLAGGICTAQDRHKEAIAFFEAAAEADETDFSATGMLMSCYSAIGDAEGLKRAARRVVARTEPLIAADPANGSAISMLVGALAVLGERDQAQAWINRALRLDPDNANMAYNLACALILDLDDAERALDLLDIAFAHFSRERIKYAETDSDLDSVRRHPRFLAMIEKAEARLAAQS